MRNVYEVLKEKGITLRSRLPRKRLYTRSHRAEISIAPQAAVRSGKRQYGSGQTGKDLTVEDGQQRHITAC